VKFLGCIVIMGLGKSGKYEIHWQGNGSMRVFIPITLLIIHIIMNAVKTNKKSI
jgi:hypothetical protein